VKNPFKVGEKVITKVDGKEVEAVVTKLWQNEVQVRISGNELRWRTIFSVWYFGKAPLIREPKTTKSVGVAVGTSNSTKPAPSKTKKAARKEPRKRS